jgi:hypothetical protein
MEDIEKSRATYVQQLENSVQHLKKEHDTYKAIAEKWEPVVNLATSDGKVTFGLKFGGKYVHATVTQEYLAEMDKTSATSAIVDALVESLVVDQLRQVFLPEVERAQAGAKAIQKAGKW